MIVTFDTSSATPNEGRSLIALLSTLYGQNQPTTNPTPAPPTPDPVQISAASPQPVEDNVQSIAEPAKRTRRTKAEIAADEAAAKVNPTQGAAADPGPAAQLAEPQASEASAKTTDANLSGSAETKAVSADELRGLLSNFITRHSMDDAIGKLKAFGCNRVTEAINLEPVKLSALAAELRG